MDPTPLAGGFVLGLAVAAPVGPMSLLCMRRTLAGGFSAGFLSGLGIASADAVYGAVAALGLVAITNLLIGQQAWLRLAGGAALLFFGLRAIRSRPADSPAGGAGDSSPGLYASTFALTLANPATILSFVGFFAGLGLGAGQRDAATALAMVMGVFLGSALWWLMLTGGLSLVRRRLTSRPLRLVNILSGLALVAFGLAALASGLALR